MGTFTQIRMATSTMRPSRSLTVYLVALTGIYFQGQPLHNAWLLALPSFFILLAGFSLNDYFDIETDRVNHPDRALAKHPDLKNYVISLYLLTFLLTVALILVPVYDNSRHAWTLLFLFLCNYNFIKMQLPIVKNLYMAVAAVCGLYAVDISGDGAASFWLFYIPFLVAGFSRELAFDIPDIQGDNGTLAKKLGSNTSKRLLFSLYLFSIVLGITLYVYFDRQVILVFLVAFSFSYLIAVWIFRIPQKKAWMLSLGINTSLGAFIAH